MNETLKSYLSATAGLVLVSVIWVSPATRAHREARQAASQAQDQQKTLQASGKIATVSDTQFTVEVQKSKVSVDPMTFTTDKDSVVDGKIVEGAMADITYRVDSGKNIVVRARITPPPNSGS
ncbi:MAG TPA: hypothetical protein VGR72_07465 [Candidatus Acidoferrales bacterium]|nr:hypothetical protein [Candidatus Acidoferrales bacterium]